MEKSMVYPGKMLGKEIELEAGPGTYLRKGSIFASLRGEVIVQKPEERGQKSVIKVIPAEREEKREEGQKLAENHGIVMPQLDDLVYAKVVRVEPFFAKVRIVSIGEKVLTSQFYGDIRKENAREFDVDLIDMHKFFRPGDIVKAKVLNVGGNQNSVVLSTASDSLGVVFARSDLSNELMLPLNYEEFVCTSTKTKEKRKVANPIKN